MCPAHSSFSHRSPCAARYTAFPPLLLPRELWLTHIIRHIITNLIIRLIICLPSLSSRVSHCSHIICSFISWSLLDSQDLLPIFERMWKQVTSWGWLGTKSRPLRLRSLYSISRAWISMKRRKAYPVWRNLVHLPLVHSCYVGNRTRW